MKNLTERGHSSTEREIAHDVKEKLRYSGLNYDTELNRLTRRRPASSQTETSSLSSSSNRPRTVTRRRPTFSQMETSSTLAPNVSCCAKVLFQTNFIGNKACGFHDTSFHSNMKCDVNIRKELYVNVVLSGGTTMFQRIFESTMKELTALTQSTMKVKMLLHQSESTRYGPSSFNRCGPRRAGSMNLAPPSSTVFFLSPRVAGPHFRPTFFF